MKVSKSREMGITAGTWNMAQGEDAVSKSLKKQIASAQKALQELSADKELTMEEKMKKRQELQQQITDLNQQLRQHQIEQRREQQARKEAEESRNSGNQQKKDEQSGQGLSRIRMEAMVSADSAMKQAKTYGSVHTRLKGETRTLGSEISLDQKRGQNVEDKVNRLAEIEKRMEKATSAQVDTLVKADEEMKEAENISREKQKEKEVSEKQTPEEEEQTPEEKQTTKEEQAAKDGRFVDIRL